MYNSTFINIYTLIIHIYTYNRMERMFIRHELFVSLSNWIVFEITH